MKNEVMLPEEVNVLASQVSNEKQEEVRKVLNQIFVGTDEWEKQIDSIEVKSIDDKLSIDLADTARKNVKNARLAAEKLIDGKRSHVQKLKAEHDLEDKLWLKTKQVVQLKFKATEEKAKWKADFVKRFEEEQKELETQKRIVEVSKYAEINRIEFSDMSKETFDSFLSGLKSTHEAKIEAEKVAEQKRLEQEEHARIYNERKEMLIPYWEFVHTGNEDRDWGAFDKSTFNSYLESLKKKKSEHDKAREEQRLENERLKAEAEKAEKERLAREAELKKEREESERLAKIEREKQAKIQAERDAQLKKEREAREKIEAEIKAKEQAVQLALKRVEAEAKALAKAPIKKQMSEWVNSFEIKLPNVDNEVSKEIIQKFEAFKKWSLKQVKSL